MSSDDSTIEAQVLSDCVCRPSLVREICGALPHSRRILIYGASGSGKTRLAKSILSHRGRAYAEVDAFDGYGADERTSVSCVCRKMRCGSVLIEQIEDFSMRLTPRDRRLTAVLKHCLADAEFVIATARSIGSVAPELIDQFDRRFCLKPPDLCGRLRLLTCADAAECGAQSLCAQIRACADDAARLDILRQFAGLQPSELLRAGAYSGSGVRRAVAGADDILRQLDFLVMRPLTNREIFDEMGVPPPRGVLLVGGSGCGKTLIARSLGRSSRVSFFDISAVEIIAKEVGESEKRLHNAFERARASAPSIILFDDIDSIAPKRTFGESISEAADRLLTTLLVETDGMGGRDDGVVVIATTTRLSAIDSALVRPGRFDYVIEVPYPDEKARGEIFDLYTRDVPLEDPERSRKLVVEFTKGLSGANIEGVIREAAMQTLRNNIESQSIPVSSFESALKAFRAPAETKKHSAFQLFGGTKPKSRGRF